MKSKRKKSKSSAKSTPSETITEEAIESAEHENEQQEFDACELKRPVESTLSSESSDERPVKRKCPAADEPTYDDRKRKLNDPTKQVYSRVFVDPRRNYNTPESRESWGPNVKGKKFRKEKGKKKRCPNAGVKIDGAVKSVRLDQ